MALSMTDRPAEKRTAVEEIRALASLLEAEVDVVNRMVDAASAKRDAILARDAQKIEETVARETRLLEEVQSLEDQRSAWVRNWTSTRFVSGGSKGGRLTVSELVASLSEEEGEPLRRVASALSHSLRELAEINQQNAGLLFHSIAYAQAMIGAMTGFDPKGEVYGPQQGRRESPKATVEWRV